MDNPNIDVTEIAQKMKIRQKLHGPTLLFLGARAGALFHSQALYRALRPFSLHSFEDLDPIERFQACIRLLEQDNFNDKDIHYILVQSLQDSFIRASDKYLATLIRRNFFPLIVTTNIDVGLEEALSQANLRIQQDFDVFIPGISNNSLVPELKSKQVSNTYPLFTLVKLYGELAIGRYNLKNRGKFFEDNIQLFQQLQAMQKWNILMVGFDPVWDAAVVPLLFPSAGKIWYVNEEIPPPTSPLFKYLQSSNVQSLLGTYGNSDRFCHSLYRHIVGSSEPLFDPRVFSLVETYQSDPPSLPEKSEQQSLTHTTSSPDVLLLARTERDLTKLLRQYQDTIRKRTIQGRICYDLEMIGDARICLMQIDETDSTLDRQIQILSPSYIIMLGSAWGFKYKGQSIGDVLISDTICIYDVEQEKGHDFTASITQPDTDTYQTFVPMPTQLLNLFKNGSIILNKALKKSVPVSFGLIFSSTETIDRQTAFQCVSKVAPHAVGIEAGDSALLSIVQRYQKNCLLVKGVSARVDVDQEGSTPEDALANAVQFVLQVIALGGFHAH